MLEEKAGYLDDMPVNVRIVNIENYPLHYHYDHEFIYVLRGVVTLKCGSSIYEMQQGDIFIINDSEVHGIYDCSSDNIVLLVQINAPYFKRQFPTLPCNVYRTMGIEKSNEEIIVLRNLLLKIAHNDIIERPGYKMMNTNIMIDVLHYCDQNFKSFYFEGKIVMHKKYDHPEIGERLGRTIDYIYEHHNEKLSLRELAEKEHFSEWYMSKLITAGTGLGFRELLAFARVEESEKILLSGSQKISSIAAEVGFSTTAYYEKFFHKWFGCHPEEYREMYSGRIKGNSPELVFELSKSEAIPIVLKSIRHLSIATEENTEEKQNNHDTSLKVTKKQREILDAYRKTTHSHEEILRFLLGTEGDINE
ncbi:MAG: helix-turn-helix transcriptional regulator [Firmicutes bacterium]|nr:helix-turn-helix transcriptional regulator [Bacillota bacterium]